MIDVLYKAERSVESLASAIGADVTTTSHHLQILKHIHEVGLR